MTRGQVRRRLAVSWWQYLALALLPLFVINALFGQGEALLPVLAMPFFIAGVASMFVSLRFFSGYKHALIATQKALDTPEEPAAWIELAARRRLALLVAALPAWVGTLAVFVGLEAVPLFLLALSTTVLFYLYRIPRQLG
ncbi:MFS transporter [Pseudomonas chlororaphis]|uniref:MFS transporter n=1 Tax=Pseudomonas morbosilactucae TaxID=2938197 RepID=A0A9X1YYY1_9PSED|nr:MFS transporter [Pseudomonas morbosilactucae]MCK9814750.1 MFS transporter [Pseudomonas morbosilactucae]ROL67123.1 MFS transporter [Pseudomonas chlororaphis]WEK09378.1 MAG: MFS transporter [Pseudomonas sp.]